MKLAVRPFDHLLKIFVHHDIAGLRVDLDWSAWAVELPALERLHCSGSIIDLALGRVESMDDGGHTVIAADRREVGVESGP